MSIVRLATMEDLPEIQAILDEPSVAEGALMDRYGKFDARALLESCKAIYMAKGGCFALVYLSPFQVDAHTIFRPAYRGKHAFKAAMAAIEQIFTTTDTLEIFTQVHKENRPVQMFTGMVGFSRIMEGGDFIFYHLTLSQWLAQANGLENECPIYPVESPFQAKLASFACKCFQAGLLSRGVGTYNIWAVRFGWPLFKVLSTDPIRVDLGYKSFVTVHLGKVESEMPEEATCQQPQ